MSTRNDAKPRRLRRFRPTERDLDLVREVWDAGMATREHLQRLYFGDANRSRAQTRVKLLRDNGYLEQVPGRWPNEPAIYVVSKRAARMLNLGADESRQRSWGVSHARLEHSMAIAECRVQTILSCRESSLDLVRWIGESDLRPLTTTSGILPDAFFQLERQTPEGIRKSGFFLEVERTEKSERALRNKLSALGTYYYGGGFERDFESKALRILVLVHPEPGGSGERLVRRVAGLGRLMGMTLLFVTELEMFRQTPASELFYKPIWSQPGMTGPVALFQEGGAVHERQQDAA